MDQTRKCEVEKSLRMHPDRVWLGVSTHNAHGLPPKPPREKRKRSPAPVAPEDQHVLTPWLASMSQTRRLLHQEIVAYVAYVQSTPQETTARQTLLEVIQKTLRRRFPDGEVKMFGSQATGLCLPTGDMDLVVMTREEVPAADKKRALFQVSTILKAARLTWDVQVNFRARAIAVVNEYLSKMPALRPLILTVKAFLSQRNLNSAAHSGLGSYAVICMCISFLQLNPSKRPQDYIDKPMETESLGALLADFMFYYVLRISPSEGKLLPKESAKWITNKVPDGLAIQCLINPENDVGKSAGRLEAIRNAFKAGYATILQLSLTNASLLGPLVSLSQSTLDHRAHIQHIVDSGELQAAVAPPPRYPKHKPTHKAAPHLTRAPPLHLPPRAWSSLQPAPPPEHVPYEMAFGAGSAMGRSTYSPHSGRAINRKGSGFASGMRSAAEPAYCPTRDPCRTRSSTRSGRRAGAGRRRRGGRGRRKGREWMGVGVGIQKD
ncbi:hypothetical protein B0H14DRAFT_2904382 [Mycena olivaceomarginata]|nr:hypothetical protein B0H14DRAFT_2904382 [Mycena olivaceomarginata]